MRALLDVNVLIALLDPDHNAHVPAMDWFSAHAREGWASCPITQNGCIRVMANPSYPNTLPAQSVMRRLADACKASVHEFWPADVSALDPQAVDWTRIHGPRQLTDIYLLALAVAHDARFVTFDARIPLAAARQARPKNLLAL